MLSDMLESGAVHIGNGGKLVFSNRGAGTLFDVVSAQAEKAVALTNRENNLVSEGSMNCTRLSDPPTWQRRS